MHRSNTAIYTSKTTTTTGQWEYIETCGTAFNNAVLFYSPGGPAVFYVDDARVIATKSPITNTLCTVP